MRCTFALVLLNLLVLSLAAQETKDKPKKERPVAVDKDQLTGIEDKKPVLGTAENKFEGRAYNYLVLHASDVPLDALAKAARQDVGYAKLMQDPTKFRGDAVHIKGRLRRLVKMDAPKSLVDDGIKVLYEGWIFPESEEGGANPYCVLFTEVPKGIELGERVNYRAVCDAFFFKIYRYKAAGDKLRDAPLLMGRTFALQKGD
jgi:hypothetical protein